MVRLSACLLAVSLLLAPALGEVCPEGCLCTTTPDGLHRATCSSLGDLYKFTLRQKHHNINILDLSHNNITKINHELDRLTEVVTLDLSTNGITHLNKFLHNANKLVHINLANNRIQTLSLVNLPTSVSSLDLTNNLLKDVPSNLKHLANLEHLELNKNPLDCSCDNILVRDYLLASDVFIDAVKCASPVKYLGRSWLELKTKDVCKVSKSQVSELFNDMMMGDQPYDALGIGEDTDALRPESKTNLGNVIQPENHSDDDDSQQFLKVGQHTSTSPLSEIEGSGDVESTTISEFIPMKQSQTLGTGITEHEALSADNVYSTDDPDEGSGEGSGMLPWGSFTTEEPTTVVYEQLSPEPVHKLIEDDNETIEFETPKTPSIYKGGSDWYNRNDPSVVTENPISSAHPPRDTTVSEKIQVTQAAGVLGPSSEDHAPHKTGTYVCIAIILVLLVGLIGFAIIKGQMRKRRDQRLLRQQKRDVEKASKEMVDMNKSLLGKPAVASAPTEKKANGKYELVPTHESHQKNGDVSKGAVQGDKNGRTDSPRDTNQNKSSSRDNNLTVEEAGPQETSFESDFASPDSAKDNHSLSSEDIFVPLNDDDTPRLNGTVDSVSQPLINGDQITDSDFLSPREYVPVYSPDIRVRIKMSETPKPKTPTLVTRSRSNVGDIIITPIVPENMRKSTT